MNKPTDGVIIVPVIVDKEEQLYNALGEIRKIYPNTVISNDSFDGKTGILGGKVEYGFEIKTNSFDFKEIKVILDKNKIPHRNRSFYIEEKS